MIHHPALDGTGIVIWDDLHTDHMASGASQYGDTETEALCDAILAGDADAVCLLSLIEESERYTEWLARGVNLGWVRR